MNEIKKEEREEENISLDLKKKLSTNNVNSVSNKKMKFILIPFLILLIFGSLCVIYIIPQNNIRNLKSKEIKEESFPYNKQRRLILNSNKERSLETPKTRTETGLDYVFSKLNIITPFGRKKLKEIIPYFPGNETELKEELNRTETMIKFVNQHKRIVENMQVVFMEMKNSSLILQKTYDSILTVVELYEIKALLLQMKRIISLAQRPEERKKKDIEGDRVIPGEEPIKVVPKEYFLEDINDVAEVLDPRHEGFYNFYIYDEFSPKLGQFRAKKDKLEKMIRKEQKQTKNLIKKKYGVNLTPKFDISVSKSYSDYEKIKNIPELTIIFEDYLSATFQLKPNEKIFQVQQEIDKVNLDIEAEELKIRGILTAKINKKVKTILENCDRVGDLDLALAKAIFSKEHKLTKPEIVEEHILEFEDGRNLQVEEIVNNKGKQFVPISLSLKNGVTLITGANMGGKTISLKLAGQIAIMAQYGFFIPAKKGKIGLSNYIDILIGDSQSLERGLSTFGSEMEELKEILENSVDRSLILIDEIASGTNPTEGTALTKSLVDYLLDKPYITLLTTHFESVGMRKEIVNMQVRGLSSCDFSILEKEIKMAKDKRDRINIISKYMDYRLFRAENEAQVPKDALNIAQMLGIPKEVIDGAKNYLK